MANLALVILYPARIVDFAALHVTMTLPGIAGFLLSPGDGGGRKHYHLRAPERKEIKRAARPCSSAIDAGFKRALAAILDSNVTTLIAAAVLYYFGTGPIRGFAVTLSISILSSMFTGHNHRWILHLVAASNLARNPKLYGA